ncbi:uracil-DNA glycosylase [Candidatus Saccharibacteria bacterium]|nr:uracil-DNA glycosylase [Candidatus Saccharibacteria bacterium]
MQNNSPISHSPYHPSWRPFLEAEFQQAYFKSLATFLKQAYTEKTIYPPKSQVFSAFKTDLETVKVIIIGQDPYHGPGQANGLAFSVNKNIQSPPSLQNIFKEIHADLGTAIPANGDLTRWAEQGVLLLNNTLTVEAHRAGSHRDHGWETFTEHVIDYLNETKPHLVFILWGNDARKKASKINREKHYILESAHPSPLSAHRGFFGSKPFSKTNAKLKSWHYPEIIW